MPKTTKLSGAVEYGGPIPPTVKVNPEWGDSFSHVSGFTVVVAKKVNAYVFVDQRLWAKGSSKHDIIEKPSIIAHVVGKLPAIDWRVDAEPISDGQLGLIVYNSRGKALLTGTYDIKTASTKLSTLYPGITNICRQEVKVTVDHQTEGGTTVHGEASIVYET